MGNVLSSICVPLLHWVRLFGWGPPILYLLYRHPLRGFIGVFIYYTFLSRFGPWVRLVQWFVGQGLDPRFHLHLQQPLDTNKRYLVCVHPHGVYVDGGLYSIVFDKEGFEKKLPGIKYIGAGADQVSYLPLFRELLGGGSSDRSQLIGVSKKELLQAFERDPNVSIGMCPGGFAEAVFTDADNRVEYSYLKGRKGFIKIAIEAQVDIVPIYQFNVNKLYHTPRILRGLRARLAQRLALPMVIWWGWWGTNQPLDAHTQVHTVVGKPFPASQYSLEELDKAHVDYCQKLKALYDEYKHQFGMGDKPLVFIGKDFHDRDLIPQVFRRLGVHTSQAIPNTIRHKMEIQIMKQAKRERREREIREQRLREARIRAGMKEETDEDEDDGDELS